MAHVISSCPGLLEITSQTLILEVPGMSPGAIYMCRGLGETLGNSLRDGS